MGERWRWMWPLVTIGALVVAGIVEAVRSDARGLLAVFVLIGLVTAMNAWSFRLRSPVTVRADLARWLEQTAAVSGESTVEVANRALSAYRATVGDVDQ